MRKFRLLFITIAFAAAVSSVKAAEDLTPDIIFPEPARGCMLYGLSDNGQWGVSSVAASVSGYSDYSGAMLYDLRGTEAVATNLSPDATFSSAYDVTDDGRTVAGSINRKPAICRFENGVWNWYELPLPDRQVSVRNENTGEIRTYKLDGGEVYNLTPDGKYAVGYATSNETFQISEGMMWNLETMTIEELPGLGRVGGIGHISADGRYVLAGNLLYDRHTGEHKRVPQLSLDVLVQSMSTDGRYFSGAAIDENGVAYAGYWDAQTDKLTVIDDEIYADAVAWTTTNDGVPLIARPHLTPYAEAYVWHDGFMYPLADLLTQVYGLNLDNLNITNTGKPGLVSADGRTIVSLVSIGNCYVLRLKEDIRDALDRMDLLRNMTVSPRDGTRMTVIGSVAVKFDYPIEVSPRAQLDIKLLDSQGNSVAVPLANSGVSADGETLNIRFRTRTLTPGETYTLLIPAGTLWIKGKEKSLNSEIRICYEGRDNVPVAPEAIFPEDGSSVPSLDLAENPVIITFDNMVKVNDALEVRPLAGIFIEGEETPVAEANIAVETNTGNRVVVYPLNTVPLYKGSTYRIVVPEGALVDMSGNGPSEEFSFRYEGSFVPQLGDDKYLFHSTCDSYTNFLFYEGDHGSPLAEYRNMGFQNDATPWMVVRESDTSMDMAFGSHSAYLDGRRADDWVTTRQIFIPEDIRAYLSFDSQSYRRAKEDRLKVYVYENVAIFNTLNSSTISDIRENGTLIYDEIQDPGASEDLLEGDWRHNILDLSPFSGKHIYICFLNDNQNQSMVIIDNIDVVKDIDAFVTLRNKTNVVAEEDVRIWGLLTIESEAKNYTEISMTLKDREGKTVSEISENGLSLKGGDTHNFEFPEPLPLTPGVENHFKIEYMLGDDALTYEGVVRNLTFEPVKRVVIEEFTGRDCQFCPGGIIMMNYFEDIYCDRVIPVALHCYNGSDPKGMNVMGYWAYTGMNAAPQARINRGEISSPLYQTATGYVNSGADVPGNDGSVKLWKDYMAEEMNEPAYLDIDVTKTGGDDKTLEYSAVIRSAIALSDQNVRVFGVLLEDGLTDYQSNAFAMNSDPIFGEWGYGGRYGSTTTTYVFDNVARGTWGTSYSGTGSLLPPVLEPSGEYSVNMEMSVPDNVVNIDNCKFAVMLIDGNTGKVINASTDKTVSGLAAPTVPEGNISIRLADGNVLVESPEQTVVNLYRPDGTLLQSAAGSRLITVDMKGYRGVVIVNARTAGASMTRKVVAGSNRL